MKHILGFCLAFGCALSSFAQGVSVRANNGVATNLTLYGPTTVVGSSVGDITYSDGSQTNAIRSAADILTNWRWHWPDAPSTGVLVGTNVNGVVQGYLKDFADFGGGAQVWTNDNGIVTIPSAFDGLWVTNNTSGFVLADPGDGSGTFSIARNSVILGSLAGGSLFGDGIGSVTHGVAGAGSIKTTDDGSSASGKVNGGGLISGDGAGTLAMGLVDSSGSIHADGDASLAFGWVDSGLIEPSGNGSFAGGSVQSGNLVSSGEGAFVFGIVGGSGTIEATSGGAIALGQVSGGLSSASGAGAFVSGHAGDGTIEATSDGAASIGYADGAGTLSSQAEGAIATGKADSEGTLKASGAGAFVWGSASGSGSIAEATAEASGAFGYVRDASRITASGEGGFVFGYAVNAGVVELGFGAGAFAHGYADGGSMAGAIQATGDGATAFGYATGNIISGGTGSYASGWADDGNFAIESSGGASFAHGFAPLLASGSASLAFGKNASATNEFAVVFNLDPGVGVGSPADSTFTINATNGIYVSITNSALVTDSNGRIRAGDVQVVNNFYSTNLITTNLFSSNAYFTNITVNNAYLTNLYVTNITANKMTVNNLTVVSNFYVGILQFQTNGVADVTVIDLRHQYAFTNHDSNFTISGFSNPDQATNIWWATRVYTNTAGSAAPKTITLPASWLDVGNKGNPVYNTNNGVLSVLAFPGQITNYVWVGR